MRRNLKILLTNRNGDTPLHLLTQRSPEADSTPEAWSLIGGCARDDESTEQAALRLTAERVGLGGVAITCLHEWVQVGASVRAPAIRSLWIGATDARTEDLRVRALQSAAFVPLAQIPGKRVPDTTAVALRLALPELVSNLRRTSSTVRGVILDQGVASAPDAAEAATELRERGYTLATVADPDDPGNWPTRLDDGVDDAVAAGTLLSGRPDPDLYRIAAKRLGLDPGECVFALPDRLGLVAASAAGGLPIRCGHPGRQPNEQIHQGAEPWPVASDVRDLLLMLR